MYSPKIYPDQIEELYKIRCVCSAMGERVTMVDLVREALEKYTPEKLADVDKKARNKGLVIIPAIPRDK